MFQKPIVGGLDLFAILSSLSDVEWKIYQSLLENINVQINAQIKSRDRKLVEQSKAILVWRPYFQGKLAGGVAIEIEHRNLLARFGVLDPAGMRILVMNPKSDIEEYRRKKLALYLEKTVSLVVPETGRPPDMIEDLKQRCPSALIDAIAQCTVSGDLLRSVLDPDQSLAFLQPDADKSSMESLEEVVESNVIAETWQSVATYVNTVDELSRSMVETDLIYPRQDLSPVNFVRWAESVLAPA